VLLLLRCCAKRRQHTHTAMLLQVLLMLQLMLVCTGARSCTTS
jgi:hypothetical protein